MEKFIHHEAANKNEAPTLVESTEQFAEAIERAKDLRAELLTFDKYDNEGRVIPLNREENEKSRIIAGELSEILKTIPDAIRIDEKLPYSPYPSEKLFEQDQTAFPADPAGSGYAHTLDYVHTIIPEADRVKVDEEQKQVA